MLERPWIAAIALGLAILFAVSGIGVYVSVNLLHDYQDHHAEQRDITADADESAIKKYLECTNRGGMAFGCAIHSVTSDGEQERAKYDLNAQQDMAEWAFALLLVTVASIALSVLGLVAIVWSLALNRAATEAAVSAVEQSKRANDLVLFAHNNEIRPYIFVKPISIGYMGIGKHPYVEIAIQNQGKTAARFVRTDFKASLQSFPITVQGIADHTPKMPPGTARQADVNPGFDHTTKVACDEPLSQNDFINAMNSASMMILVTGGVWYVDKGLPEYFTIFGFWARIKAKGQTVDELVVESVAWEPESSFSQTT